MDDYSSYFIWWKFLSGFVCQTSPTTIHSAVLSNPLTRNPFPMLFWPSHIPWFIASHTFVSNGRGRTTRMTSQSKYSVLWLNILNWEAYRSVVVVPEMYDNFYGIPKAPGYVVAVVILSTEVWRISWEVYFKWGRVKICKKVFTERDKGCALPFIFGSAPLNYQKHDSLLDKQFPHT